MIADATGHGVASALITAAARSSFSFMNKLAQEDPEFTFSPSAMLTYTNRVIYDASLGSINMTFFVGVLDLEKMELTYSSAGHNPPWLFKKNENGGFELKSLVAPGSRLGETRDVAEYEERVIGIAPSDILFLYTDGLIEGKNQAGVQYSKKRMRQKLEESLSGGPEAIIAALAEDFLRHNEGKALDDDITMAAAIILG
jgi:sigma-B regulation protein RsbU (phosphoserine phosphatase)